VCAYSLDHIPKQPSRYTAANTSHRYCVRPGIAAPHTGYTLDSQSCVYHTHTTSITEASHFRNRSLSHFHLVKEHSERRTQTGAPHGMLESGDSPLASCLLNGGAERDRTADLLRARQALSQLSYSPKKQTPPRGTLHDASCKRDKNPSSSCPLPLVWWVWADSNCRPHPYQGCALTT
jgi:hypothetical protein